MKLATELHNLALGERVGNVILVWEDGEITETKSGELLWQRTNFSISAGNSDCHVTMPVVCKNGHSYAMVETMEDAEKLQAAIFLRSM